MGKRKLTSLVVGICLVLVLAALPFMTACGAEPAATPTPTTPTPTIAPTTAPTPTPTPTPTQKPKVWELRFGSDDPPVFPQTVLRNEWGAMVEEATKGRVKVVQYDSMSLFKPQDAWSGVVTGIGDIMNSMTGYYPGQFPLTEVITLPLLGVPTSVTGGKTIWRVVQEFPEIQKEYSAVKLLGIHITEPYALLTTNKPVRTLEDIKGLKLRAPGGPPTDMTKALGAVPLTVNMPDTYLALQKGTMDGIWDPGMGITGFKHYEVAKYYTKIKSFCIVFPLVLNLSKWNSMPADVQQQIMSASGEKYAVLLGESYDKIIAGMFDTISKAGYKLEVIDLSPEDNAKFIDIGGKPVWNNWVGQWKDKGPTQKILDRTLAILAELSK